MKEYKLIPNTEQINDLKVYNPSLFKGNNNLTDIQICFCLGSYDEVEINETVILNGEEFTKVQLN